ncbi:MAG: TIM barrel protein, partial [Patescibacteria group bacterium]
VPALIPKHYSANAICEPFQETGMQGLSCGFVAGNGPSQFKEPKLVLKALRRPARITARLAERRLGPPRMVGPVHTHHGQKMPGWSVDGFFEWGEALSRLAAEFDIEIAMEPLNKTEDKTPQPFGLIHRLIESFERLRMHYDTGHAHAHGIPLAQFCKMLQTIGYFEFANVGRLALSVDKGIDFNAYVRAMADLPADCVIGDEPFDPSVIEIFGLQKICKTKVLGPECLEQDAAYLRKLRVMA